MCTEVNPWRETVDPFSLPFQNFRPEKVLDYPHAGNDVFHVEGRYKGEPCRAYIKVERRNGADIGNEVSVLEALPFPLKPELLEYSLGKPAFSVTREAAGKRLSAILKGQPAGESLEYMRTYGRMLGELHAVSIPCEPVKHRRFFDLPPGEYFAEHKLYGLYEFLRSERPDGASKTFVHGDFHYANILWKDHEISSVLDYELAGIGVREFDIAWAVLLRPGQEFLNTQREISLFLDGYAEKASFSPKAFRYYYALIAAHFYPLGNTAYGDMLLSLAKNVLRETI